jgi:hypothetical protein
VAAASKVDGIIAERKFLGGAKDHTEHSASRALGILKTKRGDEERETMVVRSRYAEWLRDPECPTIPPILNLPSDLSKFSEWWK